MENSERCPYVYSSLVIAYYSEADKSFRAKCNFAAIVMYWAAVDCAIEYELRGGIEASAKTLKGREAVPFNPTKIKEKVSKLIRIFPALDEWENDLVFLYDCFRNSFLHGRVTSVETGPHPQYPDRVNAAIIKSKAGSFTLGFEKRLQPGEKAGILQSNENLARERWLIDGSRRVATNMKSHCTGFLQDLNDSVNSDRMRIH